MFVSGEHETHSITPQHCHLDQGEGSDVIAKSNTAICIRLTDVNQSRLTSRSAAL